MAKVRVFDLAKQLNMPSKDLVDLLNELGVHAKNHMSAIDENAANYVIRKYGTELQKKEINLMSEKEPIGLEKESDKVQTEAKKWFLVFKDYKTKKFFKNEKNEQ